MLLKHEKNDININSPALDFVILGLINNLVVKTDL